MAAGGNRLAYDSKGLDPLNKTWQFQGGEILRAKASWVSFHWFAQGP